MKDKSGFQIDDMRASFKMNPSEITLNDFELKTPGSEIHSDTKLEYASFDSFNDFASKVTMNATLSKSTIAFNDAAFFTDGIAKSESKFTMQGKLKGTLSALKIKEMVFEYGKNTKLHGDVSINGLPDFKTAYMDCRIEKFQSSSSDIATLPLYDSTEKKLIVLPESVSKLGVFSFNGKFSGVYNNFIATIGYMNLDNLKLVKEGKEQRLRTKLSINASGNSLQTLEGSVLIRDSYYNYEKTLYYVNNISLTTFGFGKGRTIYIRSDFLDGEISGMLDVKNFIPSVQTYLSRYIPNAYTNKNLTIS